jgi:uncharacterized protein
MAAGRLPFHVQVMRRLSARHQPGPVCRAGLERGIEVPAADGTALLTDHYIPLTDAPCPTLLVRTPYGRGFPWDYVYGAQFAAQGFHVLIQSCRGTGGSGGRPDPWRADVADGQAAVAWLRQQDWFTGALGGVGTSYLGYAQWALAAGAPPELRVVVADGSVSPHGFFYPGGAFALQGALAGTFGMLFSDQGAARAARALMRLRRHLGRVTATLPLIDAYPPALGGRSALFERFLTTPDPADPFWSGLDLSGAPAPRVVSLVSGWDDVQLDQTLEQYRRLRAAGCDASLIVGPWNHTSIFDKGWPAVFPRVLRALRAGLSAGPAAAAGPADPRVRVYAGGRGQWRDLPDWPPPQATATLWYLGADGTLDDEPPARAGTSSFRYDPADPTPSAGGRVLSGRSGPVDNRRLEARADVLTFTSAALTEPAEILGPVSVRLRLRASSPHHDVFARLCDVDPGGRSVNVCDGLIRRRPGDDAEVTVPMSSAAWQFAAGHRIRLQVSGGAHPRYARNTGTGEPLATATTLVPVIIEVRHDAGDPCALSLPVARQAGGGPAPDRGPGAVRARPGA